MKFQKSTKRWKKKSSELELVLMPKQSTEKSPVEQGKQWLDVKNHEHMQEKDYWPSINLFSTP